jgi:uncharacterized caspase-like protein
LNGEDVAAIRKGQAARVRDSHAFTYPTDIGVVVRRVRADVIAATHQKQVPWDHSSLVGEVILVK